MKGLKLLFAGTPEFAARHLEALLDSHHRVVGVYTQPDRPAGRGKKLSASPVKQLALHHRLPVEQPPSLSHTDAQAVLADYGADLMVVVAYGLLLPQAVLQTPRLGCINVHASLLPRWRGAAPIQRAIEAGDRQTGITLMQMDEGLDTGDMLDMATCAIADDDTAQTLHDRLAELGPPALLNTLSGLAHGDIQARRQDHSRATYAHKIQKSEAQLDWTLSALELERKVRAFNPFPTAYTLLDGERLRVLAARAERDEHHGSPGTLHVEQHQLTVACGQHTRLRLDQLQLPGKKPMSAQTALNGYAGKFAADKKLALP